LYADDTQMFAKTALLSFGTRCCDLETWITTVQRWCAAPRPHLISEKTRFIFFGLAVQLQYLQAANTSTSINVAGVDIKPVDFVRNFGVFTWTADSTCTCTSERSCQPASFT
jgi:hypothetical protein